MVARDKMKIDFITRGFASGSVPPASKKSQKNTETAAGSSSSKANDHSEIDIQSVLDVLPHLTVEFVRKLLTRYDDTESAIAAVLEGNLPPDLMDTNANVQTPVNDAPVNKLTEVLEQFNSGHPEDREIVDIKLKTQTVRPKAEKRFLDDKSAIRDFHARNIEHGYVDDDYDDEYDDSYDAVVETESKAMSVLKKSGARDVLVDEIDDSEESEPDEETANTNGQRDRTRDFCENPELARERWARNREAKYGNKRPSKPAGYVGNLHIFLFDPKMSHISNNFFFAFFMVLQIGMLLEMPRVKVKKKAHWSIVKRKMKINQAELITIDDKVLPSNETEE